MHVRTFFAAAALIIAPLQASMATSLKDEMGGGGGGSVRLVSGSDVLEDSWESYTGLIFALNKDHWRDGFRLRILGTYGAYDYLAGTTIEGDMLQGDVMLGYQWIRGNRSASIYLGADFIDHDLSPNDLTNPVRGHESGFKVAADIDSEGQQGGLSYLLEGSYSTAFDTYYALGRIGFNPNSRIVIGPEAWLHGDESYDAQRLGAFVSFDMKLLGKNPTEVSLSAGHQFNTDSAFRSSEGIYGTLNTSFTF